MNVGLPDFSKKINVFFFLKYGFPQITFFRKVKETNIHSKSFLNVILLNLVYKSTYVRKNYFFLKMVDLYTCLFCLYTCLG